MIHQKNQGVSAARNAGLKILHGKVLFFVDSDDYIAQEIIEKCIRKLQEDNTDIVIFLVRKPIGEKKEKLLFRMRYLQMKS